jgi:transcriptional antiterminator RfaH
MHWYLVHTKPRQEKYALQNLEWQGYECYLPIVPSEKLRQNALIVVDEPLFPRYLFVRLGRSGSDKSWNPIGSTRGVSRLVRFGTEPAKVEEILIDFLKMRESTVRPICLFNPGERVQVLEGPFAGIEGIYQMTDGERRVVVLIELLSKSVAMRVAPASLRKLS